LVGKTKKEGRYEFKLRIVSEMLRTGPWNRLPLTIRWLQQDYQRDFDPDKQPPAHMPIAYGLVKSTKVTSPSKTQNSKSTDITVGSSDEDNDELLTMISTQRSRPRCAVCSDSIKVHVL
jgi:hypothetical protein